MYKTNNVNLLENLGSSFHFVGLMRQLPPLIRYLNEPDKYPIKMNPQVLDAEMQENWVDYDPMTYGCLPFGNIYDGIDNYWICPRSFDLSKAKPLQNAMHLIQTDKNILSRGKVDVRGGSSHPISEVEVKQMADNQPAEGELYQCEFYIKPQRSLEPDQSLVKTPKT